MPRTIESLRRNPRRLTLLLMSVALASYLALPSQHLTWLLPSASATTASTNARASKVSLPAPLPLGDISFAAQSFSVNEGDGSAGITLTRTGGSDGVLSAKVTVTDVTTSPTDYFLSPGTLDSTFITPLQISEGTAGTYGYPSIALQPDGKLLVAELRGVRRLNADGSLDPTFNAANTTNNAIYAVAVQPDGKVLIGGGFTTFNNQQANRLARLNSDGSIDNTFNVGLGTNEDVHVIVVQADGKVLIGGGFQTYNGIQQGGIARLNTDGSLDTSYTFQQGFRHAIALQPDGKALVGGSGGLNRVNTNGTVDNTFNAQFSGIHPIIFNIAVQPDGKILIAGTFDHVDGQTVYNIARLNANGSLDPTFNTGTSTDNSVMGLAVQPDGKVLIGGSFKSFNGTAVNSLLRLNTDGTLDATFVPSITSIFGTTNANNILLQPDGKIFVRGYLTAFGQNVTNKYLARLNNDLFVTWAAGDASNKTVSLPIADDLLDEADETLNLTLTPLTSGAATGANSSATLTITDNDVPPTITSPLPVSLINLEANPPSVFTHTFTATGYPAPTFSVTSGTLPSGLSLSASGVLSGIINRGGLHTVTVTASNGVGTAATQTFTIRVNNLPITVSETYGTAVNTPLTINAPGVLANDSDANGDPLTAVLESNAANGNVVLNSNGSFTYTPNPNYKGTDTFTYRASDGYWTSSVTQVNINVLSGGTLRFPTGAGFSGREDAGSIQVQILREDGSFGTTTVSYSTSDGTAQAGVDYIPVSGTVTFTSGQLVASFQVPIINDSLNESNETVNLTITGITGTGTLGTPLTSTLTITNDDTPTLQLIQRTYSVPEGAANFVIPIVRSGDPSIPVTVNYSTFNSAGSAPCGATTGLASSFCDYAPRSGTLQFAAGETLKNISIPLVDDALVEGTERFSFNLISAGAGASIGSISVATISIIDNDSTGAPPPLELILDETGPDANQAAAIDSLLALRDPFPVINAANLLNQVQDPNTRVIVWVTNLELLPGEIPSSVIVTLVDSQNHSYEIGAEVVQPTIYYNLTQVTFRLPDNLAPGVCTIKVTAHGVASNSGTIRIGS